MPLNVTFRVWNNTSSDATISVDINGVRTLGPTLCPHNSAMTFVPDVDCTGLTNELLEYDVSGTTVTSASVQIHNTQYLPSSLSNPITFNNVDLAAAYTWDVELTIS